MKPLAPNTLLQNRYLVVNLIGKGGMGEVYLAVDQRLGSAIALKRTYFSDDEMLRNAFEREARTLARLRHGVLPKVSDHFTEDETQYLIMEHIAGDDLAKRLEITQKPFPVSWVLFWADQLLDALNYLHSHEPPIIHRDIKPQNLKLTDDNSIVLLDFGLSKNSTGQTKLSTTGSVVGFTPYFAPMEQVRGTGTDARSDLYSLSATFYQLLTNVVPPDALSRADALLGGLPDPLQPINEINPEVTPLVSSILLKGMEVSQEKRFPTARSMQKALREAFAELQNGMSAQTVAYTAETPESHQFSPPKNDSQISQLKTELMGRSPSNYNIPTQGDQEKTEELHFEPSLAQKTNEDYLSQGQNPAAETPDFNATMIDETPFADLSYKQSDVKTEVFLAGSVPEITAAQEKDYPSEKTPEPENIYVLRDNFSKSEISEPENDYSVTNNFKNEENFSPYANVPLFTLEDKKDQEDQEDYSPPDSLFDPAVSSEAIQSVPSNYVTADNFAPEIQEESLPPVQPVIPPKPKPNRKPLIIAGILGVLLLLLLGVGGMGLYIYQNSGSPVKTPTPQPTAEPTTEPTVEATPVSEPTTMPVANSNSSNENISMTNTNNVSNIQPENTPGVKVVEPTKPGKTPEPPPVRVTPRPTPQITIPKPTPKPATPKVTPLPRILP